MMFLENSQILAFASSKINYSKCVNIWEVLELYKLQICNAQTQEIVREKTYKKPELLLSFFDLAESGHECLVFDENLKTLKGDYISHATFDEGDCKVYKGFFQLQESEIQARVSN